MPIPTSDITLAACNLTRRFGQHIAIDNLSLELKRGEILGLLGHNGAGKTTTLQMLTGCLIPQRGTINICGNDLARQPTQAKKHLGYLPETPPLYREFTVNDYLIFAARIRGISSSELLSALTQAKQRCGLDQVGKKIIGTLSKGYQQRVGIAQAIIHQPSVIILDEPTVGLDPTQILEIRNLIRDLGVHHSVILSTHLMNEVQSICDRVEILQNGKLIYGDTSERMQKYGQLSGMTLSLRNPPTLDILQNLKGVTQVAQLSNTQFRLLFDPSCNPTAELLSLATQGNWQLEELTPLQTTLEEVFIKITDTKMYSTTKTL